MNTIRKKDGDSEGDSGFVTPDSTTKEKVSNNIKFKFGEEVLSLNKHGIYYLGRVVMIDSQNDRCLIQFDDDTAQWSLFKDVNKLRIPESDELCVICKCSKSYDGNEIVLCSICDKGYHQKCLKPNIEDKYCEGDSDWECTQCVSQPSFEKEMQKLSKERSPKKPRFRQQIQEENLTKTLPYDLKSLHWNDAHKSNKEETYCYCGGPGEWYNKMLQCQRCKQWFHEACVDCLHLPLLYGDRFYIFVCSLCNDGHEFLHRMHIKWLDVIHLALFNLTLIETKLYFEYDTGVTQWINDNWEYLQCPLKLQNIHVSERKNIVRKLFDQNRPKFKCGREIRKKSSLYGLRVRVPPPVPTITLPPKELITEESLPKITFTRKKNSHSPPVPRLLKFKEKKMTEEMTSLLSRFSPAKKRASSPPNSHDDDDDEEEEIQMILEDDKVVRKKRKKEVEILLNDEKAKKMIEDVSSNGVSNGGRLCNALPTPSSYSPPGEVSNASRDIKKKRGRPPKNPELKRSKSGKLLREIHHRRSHNIARDTYKEIKEENNENKLEGGINSGDTSGDETSSHGTLDSFIPPPSNFEGTNHPFLNLESSGIQTMPIVRPLKRKLNENDIKIGKNGEIKRKRFRRKLDKLKYLYSSSGFNAGNGISSSSGPLSLGLNRNGNNNNNLLSTNIRNCVDYALNGRLQQSKSENGAEFSLSDLKSTVNSYFGAANRISNGEKFHILAKRTNFENKVQFLIEWDSPTSS